MSVELFHVDQVKMIIYNQLRCSCYVL